MTIVSGLAFGVDLEAHKNALEVGGRCIAVLASGVDDITPRSNEWLGRKIVQSGGALVSEFPPGSEDAYFIEYNDHQNGIPLKAYIGAAPPGTLVIENPTKITYVFHRLPDDVKVFSLLDGKKQSDYSIRLDFIGIRLIK